MEGARAPFIISLDSRLVGFMNEYIFIIFYIRVVNKSTQYNEINFQSTPSCTFTSTVHEINEKQFTKEIEGLYRYKIFYITI